MEGAWGGVGGRGIHDVGGRERGGCKYLVVVGEAMQGGIKGRMYLFRTV